MLGEPWLDGDDLYWLEGRPAEGGRRVLVRREPDGAIAELTPAPVNVRTRVHEYGGGSYTVAGGIVVYSGFRAGRLYRIDPGASETVKTAAGMLQGNRYAYAGDIRMNQWFDERGRWVKSSFQVFDGSTIEYILQE